jgi:hypothetical protein
VNQNLEVENIVTREEEEKEIINIKLDKGNSENAYSSIKGEKQQKDVPWTLKTPVYIKRNIYIHP